MKLNEGNVSIKMKGVKYSASRAPGWCMYMWGEGIQHSVNDIICLFFLFLQSLQPLRGDITKKKKYHKHSHERQLKS